MPIFDKAISRLRSEGWQSVALRGLAPPCELQFWVDEYATSGREVRSAAAHRSRTTKMTVGPPIVRNSGASSRPQFGGTGLLDARLIQMFEYFPDSCQRGGRISWFGRHRKWLGHRGKHRGCRRPGRIQTVGRIWHHVVLNRYRDLDRCWRWLARDSL